MSVINDLINIESDSLDFGNYELATKTKKDGIEYKGDIYKIKTFNEITKLEKNGMFVYESVPGTAVHGFRSSDKIHIDDIYVGKNKTNLGGKLSISVDLEPGREVKVDVRKAFD